jgi:bisphosphoglycerate-independent phosphoglycerate mutase (AlkP superfamily)
MLNRPKSEVLLSFDGFGYSLESLERKNNAIVMANTPCWDQLQKDYPMTLLDCSGHNAPEVTDHLVDAITGSKNDVIISNHANCDMVGHAGIIPAAILAVEAVDKALASGGGLSDLAPTILSISGVEQPVEITGRLRINAA